MALKNLFFSLILLASAIPLALAQEESSQQEAIADTQAPVIEPAPAAIEPTPVEIPAVLSAPPLETPEIEDAPLIAESQTAVAPALENAPSTEPGPQPAVDASPALEPVSQGTSPSSLIPTLPAPSLASPMAQEQKPVEKLTPQQRRMAWIKENPERLEKMRETRRKQIEWARQNPEEAKKMKEKMQRMQEERRLKMKAAGK